MSADPDERFNETCPPVSRQDAINAADDDNELLAELVSAGKEIDGLLADILKLRDERDRLAAELETVHTALGWADHQRAGWRFRAGLPMTYELSQVTMIGVRCDAAADITELRDERDKARKFADALERITTAWSRGMYAARIDCVRGDVKAAIECLSEGLDGYDGTEWNGTETGAEWWERTKAEEGL